MTSSDGCVQHEQHIRMREDLGAHCAERLRADVGGLGVQHPGQSEIGKLGDEPPRVAGSGLEQYVLRLEVPAPPRHRCIPSLHPQLASPACIPPHMQCVLRTHHAVRAQDTPCGACSLRTDHDDTVAAGLLLRHNLLKPGPFCDSGVVSTCCAGFRGASMCKAAATQM